MRIAIVDDDDNFRNILMTKISKIKEKEEFEELIIFDFTCADDFLECDENFDLVYMDIEMPQKDGLKAINEYNKDETLFIILTSHTEMSRMGYRVNAFRFLYKQDFDEDLKESILSAKRIIDSRITIKVNLLKSGVSLLKVKDIKYLETFDRKLKIHLKNGSEILTNEKISELYEKLKKYNFFLVSRYTILNMEYVCRIEGKEVYLSSGEVIQVSTRKINEFKSTYLKYKFQNSNA